MIKIKLSIATPQNTIFRQTPGGKGTWGDCKFFVDETSDEYDFWVVYDALQTKETVRCPKENTILITGEPESVKKYDKKFLDQFGTVITSQKHIKHPGVIFTQQSLPWDIGKSTDKNTRILTVTKNYDDFEKQTALQKTKTLSIVASGKTITEGHRKRLAFVKKLKEHFGDKLDVFGVDNYVADKWDAITPYKYAIAIENSSWKDYWTEKLSDVFLGEAYPLYFGAPNIYDYFSKESLTQINIDDAEKSIAIIEQTIAENTYEKRLDAIHHAKDMVLNTYNLFPMIASFCKENQKTAQKDTITLRPENEMNRGKKLVKRLLSKTRRFFNLPK